MALCADNRPVIQAMIKYASFALLAVFCITAWVKADSGSRYDVGDTIDIPPSKHEIEMAKGYRKCLNDACEEYFDIPD